MHVEIKYPGMIYSLNKDLTALLSEMLRTQIGHKNLLQRFPKPYLN